MSNDESNVAKRPQKIRIEFAVGTQDDGRWVTFGDDVNLHEIAEWFKFTGEAITRMFNIGPDLAVKVRILMTGPNKIAAIKSVREFTGVGLKEAKDAVEGVLGGVCGVFTDRKLAERLLIALQECGCRAEIETITEQQAQSWKCGPNASFYVERRNESVR